MTQERQAALDYAREHGERFLADLKDLVAIPSISTADEHREDIRRAAEWLADHLRDLGMENVQVIPTERHPVVYAEHLGVNNAPTVLIYGHYDVQPVDPLDLWESPPFEPSLRGENLYARGTSDMKGQVMAVLKAVESMMRGGGGLPVNVRFMLEGEEEIGSPSLPAFMETHRHLLKSDFCLNPDAGMIGLDMPTITYALRGLAYFEIHVYGPEHDLHSGTYGGVVHNPAQALAELIAGMHDEQGHITLPGFYDRVRPLSKEEHEALARLPMDEAYYLKQTGAPALWGEPEYLPVERVGARPTLEVNGLLSGFTGEGAKTVLPAKAMAKISMRLVPDQTPEEVHQQLLRYLEEHAPDDIRWEVKALHGAVPAIARLDTPAVRALREALETVWAKDVLFARIGGTIPVVADLQNVLGIESVLTGFGLPDDNLHAPNEKIHLPTWYKGIQALIHFFYNLAA